MIYNIDLLQFGDTYFIGNQSSEIKVNQIKIANNIIYAATVNGIFTADVLDPNLIDYKRWTQNFTGDFIAIEVFDNEIFTSRARNLYTLNSNSLILQKTYSQNIRSLKASENKFWSSSLDCIINKIVMSSWLCP